MKKYLLLLLPGLFISSTLFSQCTNCGIGTNSPASRLQVKGCTADSTTSSFRATDSSSAAILYVQNNKRVGINTTNPRTSLHIQTSGNGGLFLNNTSGNPLLGFYLNSISTSTFMMGVDASDSKFKIGTTSLTTNTRLAIDGSGKVGIGTTSPSFKWEVAGTTSIADRTMGINGTAAVYLADQASSALQGSIALGNGLRSLTSGSGKYNTALGIDALSAATTGGNNTAAGFQSLQSNTTGSDNTGIGVYALNSNTTGSRNTALGKYALLSNTTANNNSAVGYQSLYNTTTGTENSALGAYALYGNTTGTTNSAVGFSSLKNNTTGFDNCAVGHSALFTNKGGTENCAIGWHSLYSNTNGTGNVGIGWATLNSDTGNYNCAVGMAAMYSNTNGQNNTAFGHNALYSNTTGSYNVALGIYALYGNTTGDYNIGCGAYALQDNTTGTSNFANGVDALEHNTSGSYNTGEGYQVLMNNKTGNYNTANGYNALITDSTGSNNTGVGAYALKSVKTGGSNTACGYLAGYDVTTGNSNIFLGQFPTTGVGITTGSNNIIIGNDVRYGTTPGSSNQLNIGNLIYATGLGSANTLSTGNVGIGTASPTSVLHTVAAGAKSAAYSGNLFTNTATSSTASIRKSGVEITSTGSWSGSGASNVGLYVSSVSGGTNNYDAIFNGGGYVGVGTTAPLSSADVNGSLGYKVSTTSSSSYSAADEVVILVTTNAMGTVVTLPDATTVTRRMYIIKRLDGNGHALTVQGAAGNIDGSAYITITNQYDRVTVISDGSNYYRID